MFKSKKFSSLQLPFTALLQAKYINIFIWLGLIPLAIILSYAILHSLMLLAAIIVSAACAILFFRPVWGLYLLVVLIPFQIFPMAYFDTEHAWSVAQLLVKYLFLLTVFRAILSHQFSFNSSPLNIWITLFILIALLSIANATDIREFFKGTFQTVIDSFLLYFVILTIVDTRKKLQTIIFVLLGNAVVISIIGIFQFIGFEVFRQTFLSSKLTILFAGPGIAETRSELMLEQIKYDGFHDVISVFLNHSDYGGFLLYAFSFAGGLFITQKKIRLKIFYGILTFLFVFNILTSLCKSAWLGFIGMCFFLSIMLWKNNTKLVIFFLCVLLIVLIILVSANIAFFDHLPKPIQNTIELIRFKNTSAETYQVRLQWWKESIEQVSKHPIVGTAILAKIHNLYIQTLLAFGILGLIVLLSVITLAIYNLLKIFLKCTDYFLQDISLALCSGFIGIAIHSFFWNDLFFTPANDMMFMLFLGIVSVLIRLSRQIKEPAFLINNNQTI